MAKKQGNKWTPAQHKKFKATMAAKKAGVSSIPLSAIPERGKGRSKKLTKKEMHALSPSELLEWLDLTVRMLKAAK